MCKTVRMPKVGLLIFPFWTPHFVAWTPHFGWTPHLNYTVGHDDILRSPPAIDFGTKLADVRVTQF